MGIITKYKFNQTTYENFIPTFNSDFTDYTITDEIDTDGYTIRTIGNDSGSLPTQMKFDGVGNASLLNVYECDTSKVTDMSLMFNACSSLTSINLLSWDTSQCTDMNNMFANCEKLTSLDLSSFNTENVIKMYGMFYNCEKLTSLDLSSFNTQNVDNIRSMFYNCKNLTSLKISNFNTENVANMSNMFNGCKNLTSLKISNFNTENVTDMTYMFYNCSSLKSLDLSNFNTEKITSMLRMFGGCSNLTSLDLSSFNTENVTDMSYTFYSCSKLTSLDLSNFNTQNVTSKTYIFNNWSSSQKVYISSKWTLGTDFSPTFIIVPANIIAKYKFDQNTYENFIPTFNSDFTDYNIIDETDTDGFTIRTIGNDSGNLPTSMQFGTTSAETKSYSLLSVLKCNTDNIISMSEMFNNSRNLTSINLSSFNTQNVTNMGAMFKNCTSLTSLDLSNFNTNQVTSMGSMFYGCSNLTSLDLSSFNTEKITNTYGMFYGCSNLTSLDLSSFNTEKITSMNSMFYGCKNLTELDLSSFNTEKVTNSTAMFTSWTSSQIVYISSKWTLGTDFPPTFIIVFANIIAKYKFNQTTYENFIPEFNTDFTDYLYNDEVDTDGYTIRTIGNDSGVLPTQMKFDGVGNASLLNVYECDTSKVTDMSLMFNACSSLTSINLSSWDTSQCTDMNNMFANCKKLTSLDLSNFNTENVTDMTYMFYNCSSLKSLDLSNFNTQNITSMVRMFCGCSNLTSLDLSSFNTEKVTSMSYTFYSCSKLTSLDLSNFNTEKVTDMSYMFYNCKNLKSLDLSSFNTEKVTSMSYTFYSCSKLTSLDLSNFNTQNVTSKTYIFNSWTSSQIVYISSKWTLGTDFPPTFIIVFANIIAKYKFNQTTYENFIPEFNTDFTDYLYNDEVDTDGYTIRTIGNNSGDLPTLMRFGNTDTSGSGDYTKQYSLLEVNELNTNNINSMLLMFYQCKNLTYINTNFNTNNVTNMQSMFSTCSSLTSLDISSFNTSNVTTMNDMFRSCTSLTSLDISSFNTSNVVNMNDMFNGCTSLTSLDVSNFNTENVTTMNAMFNGCSSLTSLDISNFNTNQVANMTYMFSGCSKLTSLDLSNFSTKKVTNISYMFANCSKLTLLDLSNFNTDITTNTTSAFNNCTALKDIGLIYCNISTVNTIASLVPTNVECNVYYYDADEAQLVKPDNINYIKYALPTNIQLPPHVELRSVGEVRDEIDLKTGILIKRIEVDENGYPFILEEPIEEKVILNYTNSCDYGRILPTGTCDKYNVVTGEYYQTMTTILLDGENVWSEMEEMTNTIKFTAIGESVGVEELNMLGAGGLYCDNDLFPNINDDSDVEHCRVDEEGDKFYIYINKERLMSPDLISYQIWLQQNKFNMTYELAVPQSIMKPYGELDATQARWDTLDSIQDCMIYLTSTDKDDNYIITPTFEYIAPSSNNFYLDLLLPDTEYTIYADGINEETDTINLGGITTSYTRACLMTSGDSKWITFNSNETLNKIMIIKGNSQEENITYFKGIGNIDNPTITIVNEDETQQSTISYPDVHLRSLPTGERDYFDAISSIITQNVGVRPFENGDLENANLITDGINTLYPLIEPITQHVEHQQLLAYDNSKIKITSDTGLITTLTYAVPLSNAYRLPILKTGTVYTLKYPSASGTMTIGDFTYNITSDSMLFTTPLVINGDTSTIIFSDENPQNVILIEGEYRNREVNYFSGIKSVSNPIITIVDNTIENSERFEYKPIRKIELRSLPNGVADILDIVKQKAIISVGYRSYQQGDELLNNVWTDGYNTAYALENPVFHDIEIDTPIINTNSTIYLTSDDLIPQLNYCVPSVNSFLLDLLLPNTTYTLYSKSETPISYSLGGVYNSSFIGSEIIKLEDIKNNLLIFNNNVSDEDIMLLKGDMTNITVPYFQGVKSVNNLDFIIEGINNEKNTMTLQNNISLRACGNFRDSIDMTTCILTKELEEVILKGDENWFSLEEVESINVDYMLFGCIIDGVADSQNTSIICNRFNHKYLSGSLHEQECVYCLDNQIRICVKKTTIGGNDIDALKTWLKQNNVSIICALQSPVSENLTNVWEIMPPTSYDNKTLISTNLYSNTPKPIITITIATTTLEEIVSDLNAKNKQLEEESLVTMLAVTEVYEMIYGGATTMSLKDSVDSKPTVMSINEIEEEIEQTAMGKIYVKLIKAGMKTIEQVPYFLQEEVIYYLNKE